MQRKVWLQSPTPSGPRAPPAPSGRPAPPTREPRPRFCVDHPLRPCWCCAVQMPAKKRPHGDLAASGLRGDKSGRARVRARGMARSLGAAEVGRARGPPAELSPSYCSSVDTAFLCTSLSLSARKQRLLFSSLSTLSLSRVSHMHIYIYIYFPLGSLSE